MKSMIDRRWRLSKLPVCAPALALCAGLVGSWPVVAQARAEWSGRVEASVRGFTDAPSYVDQLETWQVSLAVEPEWFFESEDGRHQVSVVPFARLDGADDERSHVDVREAYWRRIGEGWDLTIGVNTVFWGVTESRHLVNVINQVDAVEDLDEEDFLGQPMVALGLRRPWGRLELYVLPGFRERTFPGLDGRLRGPLVVDTDRARFESSREERATDFALRYSHFIGEWDIGAHVFHGTSREPWLAFDPAVQTLVPVYDRMTQVGVDLQRTTGAWLYKLEAVGRFTGRDDFAALVAGFEYTFFQVAGSGDLGVLAELLFDDRDLERAPATVFEHDLFVGARFARNDIRDTAMLVGAVIDLEYGSTSIRLEGERRLGGSWKVEGTGQFLVDTGDEDPLRVFGEDSFVELRLGWSF